MDGKGTVLDVDDQTAKDVETARYWSANGRKWNEDGDILREEKAEVISEVWDKEGKMMPHPMVPGKTS